MEKQTFTVPNISCGHCVATIKNELQELDGVASVEGDPQGKKITVAWNLPVTISKIENALKEIGYPASD
jgi:copper chaperone CopZ